MKRWSLYIFFVYIRHTFLLVVSGKMDPPVVNMSSVAFALINVPVSMTTNLMNVFFVYCMFSSDQGPASGVKPPLNVLLWSLIGCSLFYNILNLLFVFLDILYASQWIYDVSGSAIVLAMWTGFTTSLWLNVCYFFQIVPVQWPFLVWMKQHIRLIVYSALFADRLFFLSEFLFRVILEMTEIPAAGFNSTSDHENITSESNLRPDTIEIYITYMSIRGCVFVLCVVVMLASGITTVIYLWKHMKRMEKNSTVFSVLRNKQQMRLTIIGIIQTVLFSLGLLWLMGEELLVHFGVCLDGGRLLRSVMALYSLGVNILLMIGQSKYRLMANNICRKVQRLKLTFA
ncbi:taste receptor type 2 member 3 [Danio rerio]|uniref:Taste receptor type 2 n=1 Tax=Danio rerio TaxID=7955 RepID=A6P6V4_DANRE|nr:taste receptor type 2 member 3 [Danio rerio]BAF69114.1 taste receptor, type 2, member 3 [Danio rerio]|eukprot:NP_001098605.1 taste receptor, type 2, member 3 [Danio rerio]